MASTFSLSRRVRGQDIVLAHVPLPSPEMTQNSSKFWVDCRGGRGQPQWPPVTVQHLRRHFSLAITWSGLLNGQEALPSRAANCAGYSPESLRGEHHPEIYLWAVCSNAPQLYYLRAQPWGGEREHGVLSIFPLPLMYYLLLCLYEHSLSSISTEDSDCHTKVN